MVVSEVHVHALRLKGWILEIRPYLTGHVRFQPAACPLLFHWIEQLILFSLFSEGFSVITPPPHFTKSTAAADCFFPVALISSFHWA